jgi:hypothetical protein
MKLNQKELNKLLIEAKPNQIIIWDEAADVMCNYDEITDKREKEFIKQLLSNRIIKRD